MRVLIAAAALFISCTPAGPPRQQGATQVFGQIPGLEGCTYHYVSVPYPEQNDETVREYLHIVRCPHSETSTTYQAGKTTHTSVTTETEAAPHLIR